VSNRDTFQRQTGPLRQGIGTAPLRQGSKPLLGVDTLRAQTEDTLEKAKVSIDTLEPRMELLLRACRSANLPVPGVGHVAYKHPLSPKGEQIVGYLTVMLTTKPDLSQEVQVAVFRFYEAIRLSTAALTAMEVNQLQQEVLEELKLQVFYLCRFHEVFKGDRVLAQLFPAPQTGVAARPPMSAVERLKFKKAREEVLRKAELLKASLAPRMATLLQTVEMIEKGNALDLRGMLTGSTRTARLLALGIGTSPDLVERLKEARSLYGQLEQQLEEAKAGGEVEPLKDTIYPLSRLALTCRSHPLLRDLFPQSDDGLFPEAGAGGGAMGSSTLPGP
jgi:hypothetical protein